MSHPKTAILDRPDRPIFVPVDDQLAIKLNPSPAMAVLYFRDDTVDDGESAWRGVLFHINDGGTLVTSDLPPIGPEYNALDSAGLIDALYPYSATAPDRAKIAAETIDRADERTDR